MKQPWDFIIYGPSDWWASNPSCCTHLANQFARTHKVVYVNPFSSDIMGTHSRKGLWTRITRKFKSIIKFCRKPKPNIWVISPVFLPVQGNSFIDVVNNYLIKIQISLILYTAGIKKPVLWIENIRAADFISKFGQRITVYHASDRFDECPYTKNKARLQERDRIVTQNSDLIICVSRELYEAKSRESTRRVIYLDHGVDFRAFRDAAVGKQELLFQKKVAGPVIGYFGTLTAQNDIELLEYCAAKLPQCNFVFAGQITAGNYDGLRAMSNVIFLGRVPYRDIPPLCAAFDLCLLPWKMNKWIQNCNPLKLKEYMASGKPIVSIPIREVVDSYADVVSIADNKADFCQKIIWELEQDTIERKNKRIQIASGHDWAEHARIIEDEIRALIPND